MKRCALLMLIFTMVLGCRAVHADTWKSYLCHSDVYAELVQYAELNTNLTTSGDSSVERIRNRLFGSYCPDTGFETDGIGADGYIEFDFTKRKMALQYMVLYLNSDSNVNVSELSFKTFANGQWTAATVSVTTASTYSKKIEFKSAAACSKLRMYINKSKGVQFSIPEITIYGDIAGYSDISSISSVYTEYVRIKTGEKVPQKHTARVIKEDGTLGEVFADYTLPDTFNEEDLYLYKAELPYFEGVYSKLLIDVYDDKRAVNGCSQKALANGLLGTIDEGGSISKNDAAKILFRKFSLQPSSEGDTAEEIINNTLAEAGVFEDFDGNLTAEEAAAAVFTLSGERTETSGELTLPKFISMLDSIENTHGTRYFTDNNTVLQNPDRGLFSYYIDCGDIGYDTLNGFSEYYEDLEGLSVIYVRIPWAMLNPYEDVYDFSLIDGLIEKYAPLRKQIALRILSMEGFEYTAPKWVYDKGAGYKKWDYESPSGEYQNYNTDNSIKYFAPDYEDEIFFECEAKFFRELGKKYNGNKSLAFVDMGVGLWGEGHVGGKMEPYSLESYIKRMEVLRSAFPDTSLVIVNEVEKGMGYSEEKWNTVLEKARELGFGYRNDSYYGSVGALSDSMWLPDEKEDALFLSDSGPVIMELDHYYNNEKYLGKPNNEDDIGTGAMIIPQRASYLGLHGPVRQFYEECPEFIDYCNYNLGYRIYPEKIMFTETVSCGERFEAVIDWKNAGAAKCMNDYYPTVTLADESGKAAAVFVDDSFSARDIPIAKMTGNSALAYRNIRDDAQVLQENMSAKVNGTVAAGTYDVYISMGSIYGEPIIEMPLPGENNLRYFVGKLTVKGE
ncbi:MAG: DUF4832 domain-containing protein [Monoglobaceae bacterium]